MNHQAKLFKIGEPNHVGMTYPEDIVNRIIEQFNSREQDTVLGEFCASVSMDHPSTKVSLTRASHIVKDVRIEDGWLIADIEVLETPIGKALASCLKSGEIRFFVRSTGEFDDDRMVTYMHEFITVDADSLPVLQQFFI